MPPAGGSEPTGAVLAAQAAREHWAATPVRERLRVVRAFRYWLVEQALPLAESLAGSRTCAEVLSAEILPLVDACRFLERQAKAILMARRLGAFGRPVWLAGVSAEVLREPYGVVLIVAPANYPVLLPGVQLLQALVAGNAVVLKPGREGMPSALKLAAGLARAGLPEGLLSILTERPEAVQAALQAGVHKLVFTGSAAVGTQLLAEVAPLALPATMELSGCDPVLVRADADLDMVVRALVFGLRLNAGQTCIAPRRVVVDRSIATELEGRLAIALARGPAVLIPRERSEVLGPLIAEALAAGARALSGKLLAGGGLVGPLLLGGISVASPLLRQDLFAPVIMLLTVGDDEEALACAAACPYALGASIFSRDLQWAKALGRRLRAGGVVINDVIVPTADPRLPFGGRGLSGFGVTRGREGLLEMTRPKVITVRQGRSRPHLGPLRAGDEELFQAFLAAAHSRGWRARYRGGIRLLRALVGRAEKRRSNLTKSFSNSYETTH